MPIYNFPQPKEVIGTRWPTMPYRSLAIKSETAWVGIKNMKKILLSTIFLLSPLGVFASTISVTPNPVPSSDTVVNVDIEVDIGYSYWNYDPTGNYVSTSAADGQTNITSGIWGEPDYTCYTGVTCNSDEFNGDSWHTVLVHRVDQLDCPSEPECTLAGVLSSEIYAGQDYSVTFGNSGGGGGGMLAVGAAAGGLGGAAFLKLLKDLTRGK